MARTGAPVRRSPGVTSRPRSAAPRRGGRAPSVGHKRTGPTVGENLLVWLFRVETLGMSIAGLAFLATMSLALDSSPLDGLVKLLGLHVLTLAFLLAGLGFLVWHRQLSWLTRYPRYTATLPLALLFSAGVLSLFHPLLRLGSWNLYTVSAGGDLGSFLVGGIFGVMFWLAIGGAIAAVLWPGMAKEAVGRTPGAMATVWSWQPHTRIVEGVRTIVDFAFPTHPPDDERPLTQPPAWLPPEEEDEDGPETEQPLALTMLTEPEIPDERLTQGGLPMDWLPEVELPEEEEDGEPEAPVETPWKLPPIDLLLNASP